MWSPATSQKNGVKPKSLASRKLNFNKMKKILSIIGVALVASFLFTSCSGTIKGSNTVGDWYYEISRNMGGYQISQKTILTIIRNGPGDYEYQLKETVTDAMYGGQPKNEYSSGKFEENIIDNKWRFSGGNFGNRGGYIKVPSDNWDDYKPSEISVRFASGRGNSMTFKRY